MWRSFRISDSIRPAIEKERINRTRMTRIRRIHADLLLSLSAMIRNVRVLRVLLAHPPI